MQKFWEALDAGSIFQAASYDLINSTHIRLYCNDITHSVQLRIMPETVSGLCQYTGLMVRKLPTPFTLMYGH